MKIMGGDPVQPGANPLDALKAASARLAPKNLTFFDDL